MMKGFNYSQKIEMLFSNFETSQIYNDNSQVNFVIVAAYFAKILYH